MGSNENYNVRLVDGSLTIAKADVTLQAKSATYTYNGANQSVSGFNVISGTLYGNDNTSFSATVSRKDAGTSTHSVMGSNENYNVRLVDGALIVTPKVITHVSNFSALNKIYDGTTKATLNTSGAIINGVYAGDQLTIENATAVFDNAAIGTHKSVNISNIALGGASIRNYQLGSTTAIAYADIIQNPALDLTVEPTLAKAVILNSVSESIVAKSMIVKPEDYIFVGRTYDFKSVAYSLKFDYVNNRNNLVAFNGSGINLK